jgi:hypothetical protein
VGLQVIEACPGNLNCQLSALGRRRTHSLRGEKWCSTYEGVSKSLRTGRLERELQMIELSATRCNCVAIL